MTWFNIYTVNRWLFLYFIFSLLDYNEFVNKPPHRVVTVNEGRQLLLLDSIDLVYIVQYGVDRIGKPGCYAARLSCFKGCYVASFLFTVGYGSFQHSTRTKAGNPNA